MLSRLRSRLTYANVVSSLALFIALGGTSYAVAKLPKNSVGEPQLRSGAVTSPKIKDGSITPGDLAAGTAITGPRGPRGEQGPRGADGANGADGAGARAAEPWRALEFTNGWSNYGAWLPVQFRKDQLGQVQLRGLATRASGSPDGNSVMGVLPAGYRPRGALLFVVQAGEPQGVGRVDVNAAGEVRWVSGNAGETDYTSLSGIEFSTD